MGMSMTKSQQSLYQKYRSRSRTTNGSQHLNTATWIQQNQEVKKQPVTKVKVAHLEKESQGETADTPKIRLGADIGDKRTLINSNTSLDSVPAMRISDLDRQGKSNNHYQQPLILNSSEGNSFSSRQNYAKNNQHNTVNQLPYYTIMDKEEPNKRYVSSPTIMAQHGHNINESANKSGKKLSRYQKIFGNVSDTSLNRQMNQNIIEVSKQKARQICSDNRDFYQNILKGAALVGTKPNSIVRNCIAAPVAECSALPINNNVRPHTNCPIQGLQNGYGVYRSHQNFESLQRMRIQSFQKSLSWSKKSRLNSPRMRMTRSLFNCKRGFEDSKKTSKKDYYLREFSRKMQK